MKILKMFLIIVPGLLVACSRAPEPISYGKDACAHCKMTIMDKRFASEISTAKGKVFKFDAAECMADFLNENQAIVANEKSVFLVCDFNRPGQFADAKKSWFLTDKSLSSPMGANLAAFSSERSAKAQAKDNSAKIQTWAALLKSK